MDDDDILSPGLMKLVLRYLCDGRRCTAPRSRVPPTQVVEHVALPSSAALQEPSRDNPPKSRHTPARSRCQSRHGRTSQAARICQAMNTPRLHGRGCILDRGHDTETPPPLRMLLPLLIFGVEPGRPPFMTL
jgi:hypothetical protein